MAGAVRRGQFDHRRADGPAFRLVALCSGGEAAQVTDQELVDALFVQVSPSERIRLWDYFQSFMFPHRDTRAELDRRVPVVVKPPPLPKELTRVRTAGR